MTVHGDGEQTREFVHVADVMRTNLAAATSEAVVGKAINVGIGRAVSVRELAEMVVDITGSDSDIVHTQPRSGDIAQCRADIERAKEDLAF